MPPTDPELARFAATGEEAAFGTLVERHAAMVHAAAARRLGRHAHLAADVTQQVFTRLAQRARVLPPDIVLGGWLYRQSQRLALNLVRAEQRRAHRERLAVMTDDTASPAGERWSELAPVLDEALERLSAQDRDLLLLRYFENQPLRAVGEAFGLSVSATHKRLTRALEKLRVALSRRGVVLSATSLAGLLTAEAARALPAALSPTALTAGALHAIAAGGTGAGFLTTLLMTHTTSVLAGAAAGLLLTGALYWQQTRLSLSTPPPPTPAPTAPSRPAALAFASATGISPSVREARTVEEIVAALRELLGRPQNRLTTLQVEMLMARVPPGEYLACLKLADTEITGRAKTRFLDHVIAVWGSVDPSAAVRALVASDQGKTTQGPDKPDAFNSSRTWSTISGDGSRTQSPLRFCFQKWLAQDQAAALRWLTENQSLFLPSSSFAERYQTQIGGALALEVANRLHQHSPHETMQALLSLPGEWLSNNSRILNALGLSDSSVLPKFLPHLESLSAEAKRRFYDALGSAQPEALRVLRDDASLAPETRFHAGLALLSAQIINVPRTDYAFEFHRVELPERLERLDQLLALANEHFPPERLVEIARAFPAPDSEAEAALRSRLQDRPGTDDAFEALAMTRLEYRDPGSALDWASHISNEPRRTVLMRGIFRRWQDKEPRHARHFVIGGNATPAALAALAGLVDP